MISTTCWPRRADSR